VRKIGNFFPLSQDEKDWVLAWAEADGEIGEEMEKTAPPWFLNYQLITSLSGITEKMAIVEFTLGMKQKIAAVEKIKARIAKVKERQAEARARAEHGGII